MLLLVGCVPPVQQLCSGLRAVRKASLCGGLLDAGVVLFRRRHSGELSGDAVDGAVHRCDAHCGPVCDEC